MSELKVLDMTSGGRSIWRQKDYPGAVHIDRRQGRFPIPNRGDTIVRPDVVASFTALPFRDAVFDLAVFDPPHIQRLNNDGIMARKYGMLFGDWRHDIAAGFREGFRVLKDTGTLIFKWSSVEVPLEEIVALAGRTPLFGHKSGKAMTTHWVTFAGGALKDE